MNVKRIVLVVIAFVLTLGFASCKKTKPYDLEGKTIVCFELEGGTFKNSKAAVKYAYDLKGKTSMLIRDPSEFSKDPPQKSQYIFDGWYRKKIVSGGEVTYEGKWNFNTDKITSEGITLYAKWKKVVKYYYRLCYIDELGNEQILCDYAANKGEKFKDHDGNANNRLGYTAIEFVDENGNLWNEEFTHPGDDENPEVKVYVKYIQGNYAVVRTAGELASATGRNIYLMNDIDMGGRKLNFKDYHYTFEGNGYTISNFTINYIVDRDNLSPNFDDGISSDAVCISVFGNIRNATIRNVNFENVHVDISIGLSTVRHVYVAGICTSLTNSTVENVHFSGTYSIVKLLPTFDQDNLEIVNDGIYYTIDDKSSVKNSTGVMKEK